MKRESISAPDLNLSVSFEVFTAELSRILVFRVMMEGHINDDWNPQIWILA
jgi:hypothetical protein